MKATQAITLGFLLLLAASYIDNVRGPLIPVLTDQFQISYGTTTWFLVLGNIGAVLSMFILLPLLQVFSIQAVAKGACVFFLLLSGYLTTVKDLPGLFLFAALLGGLIPVFGGLANLFLVQGTTEKDRSKWMCGLHMVYGSASLVAPIVVSSLITRQYSWISPFLVYLPLTVITFALLSKRGKKRETLMPVEKQSLRLARSQWGTIVVFCSYVAGEVMISAWMVSYLKEVPRLSLQESSYYLSGFFILITLTRGICFFSLKAETEKKILFGCLILSSLGLVIGYTGQLWGFVLAGALGPFYPVLLSQCSKRFGGDFRSFSLWLLAFTQASTGALSLCLGKASDRLGMSTAYKIPLGLLGLTLVLLVFLVVREKRAVAV